MVEAVGRHLREQRGKLHRRRMRGLEEVIVERQGLELRALRPGTGSWLVPLPRARGRSHAEPSRRIARPSRARRAVARRPTREAGANNGLHAFDFFPSAPPAGELGWVFDNLGAGGDGSGGIGIISSQPSVHYPTSRVYFASRAHPTGSTGSVWCVQISGAAGSSSAAICPTWGAARALGDVDASPILRSNKLYVGTNSSRVHALDPDTGSDLWAAPGYTDLGDGPIKGFVSWHASRSELVVSTTTKVTGLDSTTGAINWQVSLASPSIPLVPFGNPFVYAGSSDGKLYEINPTGPTLKSVALGGGTAAIGSPAWDRVNSQVVVGADDGRMYAVLVPLP